MAGRRLCQIDKGLQVLVYHKTRDFMRKVSAHVSIGAAYKKEKRTGPLLCCAVVECRPDQ